MALLNRDSTVHEKKKNQANACERKVIHNYHIQGLIENLEYQNHNQLVNGGTNRSISPITAQNYTIPAADFLIPTH
jgi:hypothetical protein